MAFAAYDGLPCGNVLASCWSAKFQNPSAVRIAVGYAIGFDVGERSQQHARALNQWH